jgi:hypothetical protein
MPRTPGVRTWRPECQEKARQLLLCGEGGEEDGEGAESEEEGGDA